MRTCLIPMAGQGRRFREAGYDLPKPLIDVAGKPMIQRVVENMPPCDRFVFAVQREHLDRFGVADLLSSLVPDPVIVPVDGPTDGAACTTLLAADHLAGELLIANADQLVEWRFQPGHHSCAGQIATFQATHPKWSYVRVDDGLVVEVAEKRPISDRATCGIYYWASADTYLRCVDEMIAADDRTNGEFYIAPAYNRLIASGGAVLEVPVRAMHGLGTPEDLEEYLRGAAA